VAWVTDLGYVPQLVRERVRDVDVLVMESNHCTRLLQESDRPWSLKQRISGRHGHLSNEAAGEFIRGIEGPNWKHVYLGHLSGEGDSVEAVERAFAFARGGTVPWDLTVVQSAGGTAFLDL